MSEIAKAGILKAGKSEAATKLRRVSSRLAIAASSHRKQSAKTQLEELRNENRILSENLDKQTKLKEELCNTLKCLADKVLEYVDQTELQQYEGYSRDEDHCDAIDKLSPLNSCDMDLNTSIASSRLLHLFTFLLQDKFGEDSEHMVNRLEELETRVTAQAQELADQTCFRVKLQNGLDDIDASRSLNEIWSIVENLRIETDNTKNARKSPSPVDVTDSTAMSITPPPDEIMPGQKLPGDTHIKRLQPTVKEAIITQLSHLKVNGADWRMFAHRVGIADSTVERWKLLHVPRPMEDVLETWGKSAGATIRMLHRHLISPQLRSRMLAKRLSDLYQVD